MQLIGTYKIPTFAICAIEYNDYSGLNDDDEKVIKDFLSQFKNGFVADWSKNIDDPYFCTLPDMDFKPCECVDVDFYLP